MAEPWHSVSTEEACGKLQTDPDRGLTGAEAERRLQTIGLNALVEKLRDTPWKILLQQFSDFMVLVLLAATVVAFALGEVGDAITIVAIVVMNGVLGFFQEYRAEQSVAVLKRLTAPTAQVVRDGSTLRIPADELVPGDVIELEAGDRIPADARMLHQIALEVDEAQLTGESHSVPKCSQALDPVNLELADRRNLVFLGTTVNRGRGRAVVVATGMNTEMGQIAHLMRETQNESTPLQRRLEQLGKVLVALSIAIVAVVVVTGLFRGEPVYQMFLTGVSLAVAAIPEGLPAIVTIALALGVQRMIRAHAVVRRLPAVETLGCTTVICSDKTGTLTKNSMTVTEVWTNGRHITGSADGQLGPVTDDPTLRDQLRRVLIGAALCNNGIVSDGETSASHGDPTELALLWAARNNDIDVTALRRRYSRRGERPFESERQRMSVVVADERQELTSYVKGSYESVSQVCRWIWWHGKIEPWQGAVQREAIEAQEAMADRALRVLAIAYRSLPSGSSGSADSQGASESLMETDLILLGLVGMIDPPRPEAIRALAAARRAGVRTVMITGDHPHTARAIAQSMDMLRAGDLVVTGAQLDTWTDDKLVAKVRHVRVYARVSPRHKLRVVRAFKRAGEVVAMTGDGVNDAPAIKEADIGVAMGIAGTDVTKEASSMILTDDNYATIVQAVQEGRAIYDNVRKFVRYLLSCNIGEVLVMFLAAFIGLPLPLLPIQILLVNLATDGLPAMALAIDPPAPGLMDRPPRSPHESVFAHGLGAKIAFRGLFIGISTLIVFAWALGPLASGLREARTLALGTLVMSQLLHVFDVRSEDRNFLEVGLLSNPWAVLAVISSIMMMAAVIYLPNLRELFNTYPLSVRDWGIVLFASGFIQIGSALRGVITRPIRRRQWRRWTS